MTVVFNSWEFIAFFGFIYAIYLLLPSYRQQNTLLLIASYYFYAAWDWRFMFLLLTSTVLDYYCALQIDTREDPRRRKVFLACSVVGNLTLLGFFKYFNFFLDGLQPLLATFGLSVERLHLDIVLPVGISFYTFQEMSYTIDVYRGELKATRRFLDFALFVAFFPNMVAGPIMRASTLLVQVLRPRVIDRSMLATGGWLIFWGLWKKVVIADNMAALADAIFANSASVSWLMAYLGVVAFAFQIYADFSGYSDIARGLARLMGIELMQNFDSPYCAVNPSDFWRRWHISLSTWLKDYVYVPLGGNRGGSLATYRNLMLTMFLGGLWHGAAWNYVWWGIYHGVLLIGHRLLGRSKHQTRVGGAEWRRAISTAAMFQFTLFGWLLFRCTRRVLVAGHGQDDSLNQILEMLTSYRNGWGFDAASGHLLATIAAFCLPLLLIQFVQFRSGEPLFIRLLPTPARAGVVAALSVSWLVWGVQSGDAFIYFQF